MPWMSRVPMDNGRLKGARLRTKACSTVFRAQRRPSQREELLRRSCNVFGPMRCLHGGRRGRSHPAGRSLREEERLLHGETHRKLGLNMVEHCVHHLLDLIGKKLLNQKNIERKQYLCLWGAAYFERR